MCKKHGAAAPTFEQRQDFLIVTFKAQMVADGVEGASRGRAVPDAGQPESQPESLGHRALALLQPEPLGKAEISAFLGQKKVSGQLNKVIRTLMGQGLIEFTLPDKPNSRLQKYRLTTAGKKALKERGGEDVK
jgi:hypothetical protein